MNIQINVVIAVLLFIASFGLFSIIANEIVVEKEDWFDSKVFSFLHAHSSPFIIQLFKGITFLGSGPFIIMGYAAMIALLLHKKRKVDAINVGILAITSSLLMYVLKLTFARHRPAMPLFRELDSYSFPSGHSFSSFVFFSLLAWEIVQSKLSMKWKWTLAISCLLVSLLVGISRIVLRYHYASDVLAGFSLGLAYVLLYFWVQNRFKKKQSLP